MSTIMLAQSTTLLIPTPLDLTAVAAGALAGTIIARHRGFDFGGVAGLALAGGLGGGILRDLLIADGPPVAFTNPKYLYTAFAVTLIGFFFAQTLERYTSVMILIESVALGLYTVVGALKADDAGFPVVGLMAIGVIAGTGGGLLIDVLSATPPRSFQPGPLLTTAAFAGALTFGVMTALDISSKVAGIIAILVGTSMRYAGLRFGVRGPRPIDVRPLRTLRKTWARRRVEAGRGRTVEVRPDTH